MSRPSRGRCRNYTSEDRNVLLELVAKHSDILFGRKNDEKTVAKRRKTWETLANEFEMHSETGPRTVRQLRTLYEVLRAQSKKNQSNGNFSNAAFPKMEGEDTSNGHQNGDDSDCDIIDTYDLSSPERSPMDDGTDERLNLVASSMSHPYPNLGPEEAPDALRNFRFEQTMESPKTHKEIMQSLKVEKEKVKLRLLKIQEEKQLQKLHMLKIKKELMEVELNKIKFS